MTAPRAVACSILLAGGPQAGRDPQRVQRGLPTDLAAPDA